jgi:D-cysteine desulfhydrase
MKSSPRLSLARLPTPIQKLEKISAELGKNVYVWRDDLNGFIDSGNKLRKLEFLVADAIAQGCDHLITCGGPQSNHTRATAAVARSLGLGISILIAQKADYDRTRPPNANLLLNQILDAELTWITYEAFQAAGATYAPFFEREVTRLSKLAKKPYVIPLGGSNALGCKGYESAMGEMLPHWKTVADTSAPDAIFCALGSGGTFLGLQLGVQKNSLKSTRVFGVNVSPLITIQKYVSDLSTELALNQITVDSSNIEIIDGYVGAGYGIASDDDLRFYQRVASSEGLVLDPCYTGKAFQGMMDEVKKNPLRFGQNLLFLHSGGVFANFAYAEQYQIAFKSRTS